MNATANLIPTRTIPEYVSRFANTTQRHQALRDQLSAARAELHRELKVVGEIQRSLLPETLPEIPGFDIASYYQPSAMAGGDYYDIVPLANGLWGLIVADVAGHGASAAVVMAMMRTLVHAHLPTNRYLPSCEFLEVMNRQMTGVYTRDGRFVTVWAAVLDPIARTMTYASAGHNPPRHVRRATITALDEARGLPLGIEESEKYEEECVQLESGDLVVVYTDGITEAARFGRGGRSFFDTERLDGVLTEACCDTAEDCIHRVTNAVNAFTGASEQTDDQTMLVIRVK